jgi:hypothetical protein
MSGCYISRGRAPRTASRTGRGPGRAGARRRAAAERRGRRRCSRSLAVTITPSTTALDAAPPGRAAASFEGSVAVRPLPPFTLSGYVVSSSPYGTVRNKPPWVSANRPVRDLDRKILGFWRAYLNSAIGGWQPEGALLSSHRGYRLPSGGVQRKLRLGGALNVLANRPLVGANPGKERWPRSISRS